MNWLLRHSCDLNDCWGGQEKFEVRIKYCAVWKKQTCLLVSLRGILSQREAKNREYIISRGKLESSGEKTYNSTRVSIRFRRTVILQEQAPVCPPKWLRERNGNDAITKKVIKMQYNQLFIQLQTLFLFTASKNISKSGDVLEERNG